MIDALITGRLHSTPRTGTGKNGSPYVTATVRVAADGDALFCSAIAFSDTARTALEALTAGDAVALSGSLTPKVLDGRDGPRIGLDLVAHVVLTTYHVRRKRAAIADSEATP